MGGMAKGRRQKAEGKRQKAEGKRQKAEGKRQKAEGKRQKAEGKRQKAEEKGWLPCFVRSIGPHSPAIAMGLDQQNATPPEN
jgi:uncharacterized protein YjbJ (UPF0337 family)